MIGESTAGPGGAAPGVTTMAAWQQGPHGGDPRMRASHAERDRAADVLKAGYAEGRLDKDEFDRRMGLAHHAITQGDLRQLISDLPSGPLGQQNAPAPMVVHGPPMPMPYGPPMHPMPYPPPVPARTNGTAVASLICGLLVLFYGLTAIPAVVLGHKARAQIKRTGDEGDGLAVTGLVFGYLGIGFWMLILFVAVAVAGGV